MPKTRGLSQGDQSPVKRRRKDNEDEKSNVSPVFIPLKQQKSIKCEIARTINNKFLSSESIVNDCQSLSGGRITNVCLKNFMNHSKLDWSPIRNVNIITGRNGSGKSSILQAIVLGLGNYLN